MPLDALTSVAGAVAAFSPKGAPVAAESEGAVTVKKVMRGETASQDLNVEVHAAARQIESYLKSVGRTLEFRVDADTHRTVVTVRDAESGDVIRQIPGDEALRLARHLSQGLGGLVDLKI